MQHNYNTPPQAPPMFTSAQIRQMARAKLRGKWHKAAPVFTVYILLSQLPAIVLALMGYSTAIQLTPEVIAGETMPTLPPLSWIGSVYNIAVAGALAVSLATLTLNIIRDEQFGMWTLGHGFKMFKQSLFTFIMRAIYSFVWTMIFMIPAFVVLSFSIMTGSNFLAILGAAIMMFCAIAAMLYVLRYELSYYVATDNPGMKATFALANSSRLMHGNIWNFIRLNITFIGWAILASVPEGICGFFMGKYFEEKSPAMLIVAVVTMIIAAVAYGYFAAYIQTAKAVFYSAASGFFRTAEYDAPDPQPYTTLTPDNIEQEINNMKNYSGYTGYNAPQSSDYIPERIPEEKSDSDNTEL